jgi:hypothetical protein
MSTTANVALAVTLLLGLGSSAIAGGSHGKPVHRTHAPKLQLHAPPSALDGQYPERRCVVDEGGGRLRPCGSCGGGL